MNKIRVVVWGENVHEQIRGDSESLSGRNPPVHRRQFGRRWIFRSRTATLQDLEHGLSQNRLSNTDVLLWWGHIATPKSQTKSPNAFKSVFLKGWGWWFYIPDITQKSSNG